MVCKIRSEDSNGILEYGKKWEVDRHIVYRERLQVLENFLVFCLCLFSSIGMQ